MGGQWAHGQIEKCVQEEDQKAVENKREEGDSESVVKKKPMEESLRGTHSRRATLGHNQTEKKKKVMIERSGCGGQRSRPEARRGQAH